MPSNLSHRRGELRNFTGIDSPYEAPLEPELHLDTTGSGADDCLARLLDRLG